MSDDAGPSSAAVPQPGLLAPVESLAATEGAPLSGGSGDEERSRIRSRRAANLKDIIRSLDLLIYVQIATVYYMDTSLLRFILRAFMQLLYLTPKPHILPNPPNLKDRPYIGAIFGTNILCFLLHLWFSRPSAGEATRGYLHGGLLIDFVGQEGPTSKLHLLLLDVVITALQMIMLAATAEERSNDEKRKVKSRRRDIRNSAAETQADSSVDAGSSAESEHQNHDAEERGLRRSMESSQLLQATEFQDLNSPEASVELLDRLRSGQALTVKFYIIDVICNEFISYNDARRSVPNQTRSVFGNTAAGLAAALSRSTSVARQGARDIANG